jgi:hypothetical protein
MWTPQYYILFEIIFIVTVITVCFIRSCAQHINISQVKVWKMWRPQSPSYYSGSRISTQGIELSGVWALPLSCWKKVSLDRWSNGIAIVCVMLHCGVLTLPLLGCALCVLLCYMCDCQWHKNIECVVTLNNKILKMLPWKCSSEFPLYYWAASCCQQFTAVECCHGSAAVSSLWIVVELQSTVKSCGKFLKRVGLRSYIF